MTTEANAGSATVLEPNAGTSATAANGGTTEGSTSAAADPFSALDTDTREWIGKAGLKDVAGLAAKARNAESLIGRSIQLPDDKAKPEDWDKVWARLGRPEKADGYEFKLPEGLPQGMTYDEAFAKEFKAEAHKAGLTPKQAQAAHDFYVGKLGASFKATQEAAVAKSVAATEALAKAWGGGKDTDQFKQGVNLALRALDGLDKVPGATGLKAALEASGVLLPDGSGGSIVMEPAIAVALAHIGKALFSEDRLVTGGAAAAGENPFAKGNMTEQMLMIRTDPDKARRMISAAGKTPADFGWSG